MTYKKLLIIFIAGLLLVGAGVGVCIWEFGNYAYKGVKEFIVDEELLTTDRHRFTLETKNGADENDIMLTGNHQIENAKLELIADESLRSNEMIVEVTYDKNQWQTDVYSTYMTTAEYTYEDDAYIIDPPEDGSDLIYTNEICVVMYHKNGWALHNYRVILDDLRNRRLYDYDTPMNHSITIYANEDTLSRIKY